MQWKDKIVDYLVLHGAAMGGALVILIAGFAVARIFGKFAMQFLNSKDLEPPVRLLLVRVFKLVIIALSLVIALGTCGVEVAPLVAGIGVAGVGLGLATQGVLSNLVAGLLIIFTKPFRVGEYIEIIGVQGQVEMIELFSTILVHPDKSRIIIPNRKISGEVLHNYGTIRQLDLSVGVAYHTNLPEAIAIVRDVLKRNTRVLKEFNPGVGINTLADSSINLSISPWVAVPDYGAARTEIYQAIIEEFRARRVEIPFPHREVRMLTA